jgi:hypothetical protein
MLKPDAVLDLDSLILLLGSHSTRDDGVCAMEAVAWLAGEPHSDRPACACPVIASFVRAMNDQLPDEERGRLKPYLAKLVGTRLTKAVELKRAFYLADSAVRVFAPLALRAAGLTKEAEKLESLSPLVDEVTARAAYSAAYSAARAAYSAAYSAARAAYSAADSAAYSADSAADSAAYSAASSAARAVYSADSAARAADSAAYSAAYSAARAARDADKWKSVNFESCLDAVLAITA